MYIVKHVDLNKDKRLESKPICLKDGDDEEIYCMGILERREIINEYYEGLHYYNFIFLYGRSPINFGLIDYGKLQKEYSFDMNLELIADFRYCYNEPISRPGLFHECPSQIIQVSKEFRMA
ncbi:hypothetical protein C1Y47_06615 [Priestia megaterium]|nr:hypothetical protein [Priestia megaterium]PNE08455.1 hypothetical protein C1Y47_06615 [Priestia megaterium]